jgi:NAD(P)-dependent dehydrogenase (short-subunit alcohol dehydrogenase family)
MPPVTFITGAGSGIGREIAIVLSGCRHALALVGRTESSLRETASLLHPGHPGCAIVTADVSQPEQATGAIDRAVRDLGTIDNLVNNAGAAPLLPIEQHSPRVLEDVYRVNAIAPANLIARAWPVFKRQRTGCIVNISTIGTLDPFPGFFGYAAAKAALNTMTLSCAKEGAHLGIRAFTIAPGAVETHMLREVYRQSGVPHQKGMPPIRIAQVVQECIEHRRDDENGKTIVIEG